MWKVLGGDMALFQLLQCHSAAPTIKFKPLAQECEGWSWPLCFAALAGCIPCPCPRHSSLLAPASPPTLHTVLCNWWFIYLLSSFFGPFHSCFFSILQVSAQMAPLCATLGHINLCAEIPMAPSTLRNLVCFWLPPPPGYKDQMSVPLKTEALLPLALRAHPGTEWCPWTLSEWVNR